MKKMLLAGIALLALAGSAYADGHVAELHSYNCDTARIKLASLGRVQRLYVDKISQVDLDEHLGRRLASSAQDEMNDYVKALNKVKEDEVKLAKEYLDNGCTENAAKIREITEALKRN
jgi:3-phosphoglycerate kinase